MNIPLKASPSKRINELDALRGIAALFVVVFHLTMVLGGNQGYFRLGVTGVDLFFMISGFVILLTLERTATWKDFLINRLSRLYPTYWACVTITAIFLYLKLHGNWPGALIKYSTNMTMFQLYFKQPDIDGSYWTMLIEMLFYMYMLFLFVIKKIKSAPQISMLLLIPNFILGVINLIAPNYTLSFIIFHLPLIAHFPLFCAGIIFYKIKFSGANYQRYASLVLCLLCQLLLFKTGGKSRLFISMWEYVPMLSIYFLLFLVFVKGKLKFLINPVTLFLGNISFSLYLIHQEVGIPITTYLAHYVTWWLAFALTLCLVVLLGFLINRFIEVPSMRYLRRKYASPRNTGHIVA